MTTTGISGGQRKRTAVGVEIITRPSILFLDEPTSGLDSYQAYNLIENLKIIAGTGCPVICSIHQPSSEIFYLFDIAIFMKSGESMIVMMMIIIVIVMIVIIL